MPQNRTFTHSSLYFRERPKQDIKRTTGNVRFAEKLDVLAR
jgi:hypothetical protein